MTPAARDLARTRSVVTTSISGGGAAWPARCACCRAESGAAHPATSVSGEKHDADVP